MAPTNENNAYMMGQQQPSTTMYGGNQAGITSYGTVAHMSPADTNSSRKDNKSKKSKKDKKKIIRKEDISNPTNFQHMAHVGWDQDGGFSQNIYGEEPMDETVREILKAAGHNPELMSKEEIKFTYDFIEKWQRDSSAHQPPNAGPNRRPMGQPMTNRGSESVKAAAPPPPPPRDMAPPQQQQQQRGGPPPPRPPPAAGGRPPARPLPQPPPAAGRPANVPPPPPPPMPPMQTGAPPPPPPPPPPPMSGGAAPPPPPPPPPPGLGSAPNSAPSSRNNLLSEIQKGAKLKSVQSSPGVGSDDAGSRDTVMAQIRQGAQLKHVDKAEVENRKSAVGSTEMGGIAGALARALEERRKNMRDSEESSDDEAANDSEWEDD
uniref:Uncharacterized protein n=2 Tax=Plectus sambesii TaxID=2011161 RepID=A0A914W4B8_9BILA